MARVEVFQGGRVQRQGLTNARQQGADYGASPLEVGLKSAGKAVAQYAEQEDQLEDVEATIEAQRLALEHSELTRALGRKVKESMGENADPVATGALTDLEKQTNELLGRASPRARLKLQNSVAERNIISKDSWLEHGFGEKKVAFDANSIARLKTIGEDANDEDDEGRAFAILGQAPTVLSERAKFYGWSKDVLETETKKFTSDFIKSRSLKKAAGDTGSASAAIEYATANRSYLSDDDYNSILTGFDDAAMEERAMSETRGEPLPSATTATVEVPDPLAPNDNPTAARRLDPKGFFKAFTVPHEGAAYVVDSNGAGVKYGINAEYNPGVDVKNLTEAKAAAIFEKNYFQKSGADKLPPAIAAVHVDTFYLNEREAVRILRQSGGDVDKYIELRHAFLDGLAAKNPGKFGKYQKGWRNRTNALAAFADRQGGDGTTAPIPIAINTSMRSVEDKIMARTDVGLKYKRKLLGAYRDQQQGMREERESRESESNRLLTTAALELGDGFTSITQLPANVLASASPSAIANFTNMARGNKESKPLTPDLAALISYVEVADPKRFATQAFRDELIARGAPLSTIRSVADRQGQIAGRMTNPTAVDPIADGSLWTIAKEPFEAAGILLDTVEGKGNKATGERQADAQTKLQAIGYLRDMTNRWMANNPGKKPDDATIRGWVGWSLLKSGETRAFQMTDQQTYMALPQGDRQRIIRELYRGGPKPPSDQIMRDVVAVHRNIVSSRGR